MNWSDLVLRRLTHATDPGAATREPQVEPSPALSWRADVPAALIVFLVAVPLCLGIALASGAPLFAGIVSGMVGGVVVGALSGSPLMISGPAAGLAAIAASAIDTLGSFEAFLAVVVVAGLLQLLLASARAGIVGYYFPSSVVRGLLTAIGLILVLKQVPHALGYDVDFEGDEAFVQGNAENTFTAILNALSRIEPAAAILSATGLLVLVLWERAPRHLRGVPGALVAVLLGVAGQLLLPLVDARLQLGPEHLVALPVPQSAGAVAAMFATPDWSALLRLDAWRLAVTLGLVASLETLITLEATDKLDRFKREAPANRELAAQGLGNVVAGLIGGLPLSGVLVRSAANVEAGAQTKMAAVIHGLLLAVAVFLTPRLLNHIPFASLAAVLIYTGIHLVQPATFRHMWVQGPMRFVPFLVTVAAILLTDMLVGIIVGLLIGFLFIAIDQFRYPCFSRVSAAGSVLTRIRLHNHVTFLNKGSLARFLEGLPPRSRIEIDGSACHHIDYDVLEYISDFRQTAALREIDFRTVGITLPPVSPGH